MTDNNTVHMVKNSEHKQNQKGNMPIDFYPFAYALFDDCLAKYCWYCLDEERTLKCCTGCQRALFCDKRCQTLAWKDHKFECRGIRANGGNMPELEVRLLGRIVARHKAILCGLDKKDPDFYNNRTSRRNIMDIWAHTKNIEKDEYAIRKFERIYDQLCHFYEPKALLNKRTIFELHCRDFINRHAISDKYYLREIGKGLYLDLCAYDHSCQPNAVYSCHSFIATLRPLHPQVNLLDRSAAFYSYIDLLCSKQDRRKLLRDTWYFRCECERCMDESEHALTAIQCPNCQDAGRCVQLCVFGQSENKDPNTLLITCPECAKTLAKEQVMEAISAMHFISDMLENTYLEKMDKVDAVNFLEQLLERFSKLLPPKNVYICKIVQALLPYIEPDDSKRLLELHLMVEECIRMCYPHNHPALAFHLRNIGIFAKNLGRWQCAEQYLREALQMFTFVMGTDHSLSKMTSGILKELEQQQQQQCVQKGVEEKSEESEMKKNDDEKHGNGNKKKIREEKMAPTQVNQNEDDMGVNTTSQMKNSNQSTIQIRTPMEDSGLSFCTSNDKLEEEEENEHNNHKQQHQQLQQHEQQNKQIVKNITEIEKPIDEQQQQYRQLKEQWKAAQSFPPNAIDDNMLSIQISDIQLSNMELGIGQQECYASSVNCLSPNQTEQNIMNANGHSSPGGGVKKKLQQKKCSPRSSTPLPPRTVPVEESGERGKEEDTNTRVGKNFMKELTDMAKEKQQEISKQNKQLEVQTEFGDSQENQMPNNDAVEDKDCALNKSVVGGIEHVDGVVLKKKKHKVKHNRRKKHVKKF